MGKWNLKMTICKLRIQSANRQPPTVNGQRSTVNGQRSTKKPLGVAENPFPELPFFTK
jgi:hypothetical protein